MNARARLEVLAPGLLQRAPLQLGVSSCGRVDVERESARGIVR
jgi:hypothetical protein